MKDLITITRLTDAQKEDIRKLWNENYPASLELKTPEDFDHYLAGLSNTHHFIGLNDDNEVQAWGITFSRESETWFAIILDAPVQKKGWGTEILSRMKEAAGELNGWVIDHSSALKLSGDYYLSPMSFYTKNGFSILSSKRLETQTISAVQIHWKKLDH